MPLHKDFPQSPHAILDPGIRRFPADGADKELIIKHIKEKKQGTARQFQPAFKDLKPMDISNLLRELKNEGKLVRHGSKKHGYWTLPENATD